LPTFRESDYLFCSVFHAVGDGKFRPDSRRIFCPISTLVPSIRTTTGTFTANLSRRPPHGCQDVAAQYASKNIDEHRAHAGIAHQNPKCIFDLFRRRAAAHIQKIRGEPPAYLMMSMVAMANPAPLTMQDAAVQLDVIQSVFEASTSSWSSSSISRNSRRFG